MSQLRHGASFAQKPLGDIAITGKLSFDNFYGDWSLKTEMCGEINRTHSTGSDLTFDPEPTCDELGDIHR
jgi:hypothetical protein